ncbi:MAG: GlsB/YeaQ/YmgE family stress response membrane protein [Caldilineaceae bacterium]|nr:GlsB/YeaQ/YmgE family stress response membrane protein [Caldilineaceae bacterium]
MGILAWIVFGAIAGWIAHRITGRGGGLIMNIVVGIVGAFIGGFIMSFFGGAGVTGFDLTSFIVAILGAVILLWIMGKIRS